ncbi:hypothetical protein CFC21_037644 [Triticum aestivum]|uniref:Uncharacterized protein n=2 Tax=Triticum aestivum TaxID=4565 RepID=A0A3B6ENE6_WHEAT|nr:hypothetical protein CFC21_037644 [Triticum aestivum]
MAAARSLQSPLAQLFPRAVPDPHGPSPVTPPVPWSSTEAGKINYNGAKFHNRRPFWDFTRYRGPVEYNHTTLIREPLPLTSEEHGFTEYPFILSRLSSPSTTSARLRGLYQVPLRFSETGKSEDPKYHDNPEGIQIRQVPLPMTRTAMKRVPLLSTREDPMDVKFRVMAPKIYGHERLLPLRLENHYFRYH